MDTDNSHIDTTQLEEEVSADNTKVIDNEPEKRKSQEIVDVSSDEEEENINDEEDNDKEENDSVTLEQESIDFAASEG